MMAKSVGVASNPVEKGAVTADSDKLLTYCRCDKLGQILKPLRENLIKHRRTHVPLGWPVVIMRRKSEYK